MNGQKLLDNAIFYERRKNWKKAILFYNDLFKLFEDDAFVKLHKHAPDELKILKFQCYYHCAVAHQKQEDHSNAISTFEQAITVVGKRKNGCSSGCVTGSDVHWSVPAYSRKAFSEIYLGNFQEALRSSEKAVLLDSANPDVYCIRAIIRFMLGDKEKATADVTRALRFNPSHVCALIERGWFENSKKLSPLSTYGIETLHRNSKWNIFEEKAYGLNPCVVAYFGLPDKKDKILEALDKFLPTVRCPHTVTVYDVSQIAQAKCKAPEKRGTLIAKRSTSTSPALTSSRETSMLVASNRSVSSLSGMKGTTEKDRIFSSSFTSQGDVSFANNFSSLTETRRRKTDKKAEKTELSEKTECCKGCSSVEEFLKHLIWNEETTSI